MRRRDCGSSRFSLRSSMLRPKGRKIALTFAAVHKQSELQGEYKDCIEEGGYRIKTAFVSEFIANLQ